MTIPDFERAEYDEPQAVDGTVTSAEPPPLPDKLAFPRAISYGFGAAILGAILYAIVGIWVRIGFIAIIVGGMVGNGMMNGSRGTGGRKYQVAALLLTYFAVSLAMAIDLLIEAQMHEGGAAAYASNHPVLLIAVVMAGPFLALFELGSGLFGLLMLFFAMQQAWKVTAGGPGYIHLKRYDPNRPLKLT